MYQDILVGIAGIEIFPVLSLLLFVVVFAIMLIRVASMDRGSIERLQALPLDAVSNALQIEKEAGR